MNSSLCKNEKNKRCIFYLPYKMDEIGNGARMVRPLKMINAFKNIGYEVFVIQGYSSERKKLIKRLKQNISSGIKYDFMYTESSTEPTLLTNPNHYPTHPFMDFSFFKYIKKQGIKIGLFYCDIYWKFKSYGSQLSTLKKYIAIKNYEYDIRNYEKLLDVFYVSDVGVSKYIDSEYLISIMTELPPGADNINSNSKSYKSRDFKKNPLKVFYVGGLGAHYQIKKLIQAVAETKHCEATICCRKQEFEKEKKGFEELLNESITIIHKSGTELDDYYMSSDIGSLLFEDSIYMSMAKPVKAYEYIANELPIISTRGTAIGEIVEKNNLGFNIDYEVDAIKQILNMIIDTPFILDEYKTNCALFKEKNLWECRARRVENDLT